MLSELRIENLALIESLHLDFDQEQGMGLVVMTGETGAGKSIMMRALGLLSGARASADWIRAGAESCTVEAVFQLRPEHGRLRQMLAENGFGDDDAVIIRRMITVAGRSKLYVNGSPVTARQAADLTADLLSIASQHDHQQLLQPQLHLDFLDTLGELWPERESFAGVFRQWQRSRDELEELRRQEQDKERRRDLLRFQVEEIRSAAPVAGEDERLAAEKKRLKSADSLIRLSQESYALMATTVVDSLAQIRRNMEQLLALDPQAAKLAEDLSGYNFMAEDHAAELRHYRDALESDPVRLERVGERLDVLQGLKRKYGETLEDVLLFAEMAERELAELDGIEQRGRELERQTETLEQEACALAARLGDRRREVAAGMEKAMEDELASLAFRQAGFNVSWQDVEKTPQTLRASGWDRVEFFFSANPGEPARPLARVASGGELSRLMLALKCLLARRDMVDTVVFDEVDAGIGGEAAEAVARKIRELASHHQVFCITHLPQIAARGHLHFQVVKEVVDGRTLSRVLPLARAQRVRELARMLAGESASGHTEAWAEELLAKGEAAA
jgi:DNA repair protein RecN (Recombination protein N)